MNDHAGMLPAPLPGAVEQPQERVLREFPAPGVGSYPVAPPCVVEHLRRAMLAFGVNPSAFVRKTWRLNRLSNDVRDRQRVWWWMRTFPMQGGGVPSYPEIASACAMTTHSTIIAAVRREQQARDRADAIVREQREIETFRRLAGVSK